MAKMPKMPKGKKPALVIDIMKGPDPKAMPAKKAGPMPAAPAVGGPRPITLNIHHHHYAPRIPAHRVIERVGPNVIRDVRTPIPEVKERDKVGPNVERDVQTAGAPPPPLPIGPRGPVPAPMPSPMPQARPRSVAPPNRALRMSGNPNAFKFGRKF